MSNSISDNGNQTVVPKRILASLLNSLSAGVVPRSGAPYVAIGRTDEIKALTDDLSVVENGGSAMRFIVGRYGSGKSFLMQLFRGYALDRGFLTADADLSPERRICGQKGAGVATYRELMKNLSCRTSPDGAAFPVIISKWLSSIRYELVADGFDPETPDFNKKLKEKIYSVAEELENYVGGFDFATVIVKYYEALICDNEDQKRMCLKWLRGEYNTKTEAKNQLSVGSIINDLNWHDMLKLIAAFARKIGYKGLCVFIDECVNLYKIPNRIARENNYEKILSMFNDSLQGRAPGLDIIFSGTPQFLEDERRGLFSYEALRSRLCDSRFGEGYKNMLSPVIRLKRLSDNELLALLTRVTKLHSQYYDWEVPITSENMIAFLKMYIERMGADIMLTPREILRDYISVLGIILQNPEASFENVIKDKESKITHGENNNDSEIITEHTPETLHDATTKHEYSADEIEF